MYPKLPFHNHSVSLLGYLWIQISFQYQRDILFPPLWVFFNIPNDIIEPNTQFYNIFWVFIVFLLAHTSSIPWCSQINLFQVFVFFFQNHHQKNLLPNIFHKSFSSSHIRNYHFLYWKSLWNQISIHHQYDIFFFRSSWPSIVSSSKWQSFVYLKPFFPILLHHFLNGHKEICLLISLTFRKHQLINLLPNINLELFRSSHILDYPIILSLYWGSLPNHISFHRDILFRLSWVFIGTKLLV